MTASAPIQASSSTCVLWICTPALPAGLGGVRPLPALGSTACVHPCAPAPVLCSCVPATLRAAGARWAPHCAVLQHVRAGRA